MGRIYSIDPQPGELDGKRMHVFWPNGRKMIGVYRVEFDDDTDDGMATVFGYIHDTAGQFFVDLEGSGPLKMQFRIYARIRSSQIDRIEMVGRFGRDADGKIAPWQPIPLKQSPSDTPLVVGG